MVDQPRLEELPVPRRGRAINIQRGKRNDFVHSGLEKSSISELDACRFLCAAVFGLEHLRYVTKVHAKKA